MNLFLDPLYALFSALEFRIIFNIKGNMHTTLSLGCNN